MEVTLIVLVVLIIALFFWRDATPKKDLHNDIDTRNSNPGPPESRTRF